MRFRSKVSREGIALLLSTFQAMGSVHAMALVLLDPTFFRVSVVSDSIENPRGYLEIAVAEFFVEYRVESAAHDRIALEVSFPLLIQALSSGKNTSHAVVKLSKFTSQDGSGLQKPCLSIVLDGADQILNVDVLHEIPVRLLKVAEVLPLVSQPDISPPTVSICLPPKKKLVRTLFERLSKLAKVLTLRGEVGVPNGQAGMVANPFQGRLTVTAVSDLGVTVNSFLSHLEAHPTMFAHRADANVGGDEANVIAAEVRVSAKKLLCVLDHVTVPHSDIAMCKLLLVFSWIM